MTTKDYINYIHDIFKFVFRCSCVLINTGIIVLLFATSESIKVNFMNKSFNNFLNTWFDPLNVPPRIFLCYFIIFLTIILSISWLTLTLTYTTLVGRWLYIFYDDVYIKYKYFQGNIHTNSFFSIDKYITQQDKDQWLDEKISNYQPANDYEPSKQWLINQKDSSFQEFKNIEELNSRFTEIINAYSYRQQNDYHFSTINDKVQEINELKNQLTNMKTVSEKVITPQQTSSTINIVHDNGSWISNHPYICAGIVIVGFGLCALTIYNLSRQNSYILKGSEKLAEVSKEIVKDQSAINTVAENSIVKVAESSSLAAESIKTIADSTVAVTSVICNNSSNIVESASIVKESVSSQGDTANLLKDLIGKLIEDKKEFRNYIKDLVKEEIKKIIEPLYEKYIQETSKMIEISTTSLRIIIRSREHLFKQKLDVDIPKKDISYLDDLKEKLETLYKELNDLKGIPNIETPEPTTTPYTRQAIAEKRLEKFGITSNASASDQIQSMPDISISSGSEIINEIVNQITNS